MLPRIFIVFVLLFSSTVFAQTDSVKKLSFSGYIEIYYSHDLSVPTSHIKPGFIYNHKRNNEINLNLLYEKVSYQSESLRANLALMVGNYSHYNLANEPGILKNMYEADAGVRLSKKKNIWLDAGIMPSHIGFETSIGADCWTLTRSILAENSPYYETGIKISYSTKNEKLNASFLVLNGWQHMKRPNGINKPAAGIQITYKPSDKIIFNYSNFIGTDKPDSSKALRTYHNFYLIYESGKFGLTGGLDLGTDKKIDGNYSAWLSPVLIIKMNVTEKISIAGRIEYFYDKRQLIISTGTTNGFQTFSFSVNLDYRFFKKFLWRVEARTFSSRDKIFIYPNGDRNNESYITTTFCLKL